MKPSNAMVLKARQELLPLENQSERGSVANPHFLVEEDLQDPAPSKKDDWTICLYLQPEGTETPRAISADHDVYGGAH